MSDKRASSIEEFDRMFDNDELDVTDYIDVSALRHFHECSDESETDAASIE